MNNGLRPGDAAHHAWGMLRAYPLRTGLTATATAIGVAAIIVLTALGEGAREYVRNEFVSLGSHLLIVVPGRSETAGIQASTLMGETPRDLTIDDALALRRHRSVKTIAPLTVGSVEVSTQGRLRDAIAVGSTHDLLAIRRWRMGHGRFLPETDWDRSQAVVVIGRTIERGLFGPGTALGHWLRIGDRRFRVIGVLASTGRSIGLDVDEIVVIPVATALELFDQTSLFRILVEVRDRPAIDDVRRFIVDTLRTRHQGERDVTVITQDAVVGTFDRLFDTLGYVLAGIAAISLGVAGILIMNVMLVMVSQHRSEIGLLKALGAAPRQILGLFVFESIGLSGVGAVIGLMLGEVAILVLRGAFPELPVQAPVWAILSSTGLAIVAGCLFSLSPAYRASRLDPIQALSER